MSAISNAFTTPTVDQAGSGGFEDITTDEFLEILLTELTNQDPLQPTDTQAMIEQLSALRSIESETALQESLETLVLQNNISQAGSLLGKVVEGLTAGGDKVSGLVTSVRVVDGSAELELDTGRSISIDRVTQIAEANGV